MTDARHADWLRAQRENWSTSASGWDRAFDSFETWVGPLGSELARLARVAPGSSVIDVGCGNGAPTLELARLVGERGRVLGVDLAEPMVEIARRHARERGVANASFVARDAQDLSGLGPFDAAVSRFCVMLVPDPVAAARAVRSVLAPGARFAACVWGPGADVPFCGMVPIALQRALAIEPPGPDAPGPVRLGAEGALAAVLREGGFRAVVESTARVEPRFASMDDAVRHYGDASGGVKRALDARGPDERARFTRELERALAPHRASDGSIALTSLVRVAVGVA